MTMLPGVEGRQRARPTRTQAPELVVYSHLPHIVAVGPEDSLSELRTLCNAATIFRTLPGLGLSATLPATKSDRSASTPRKVLAVAKSLSFSGANGVPARRAMSWRTFLPEEPEYEGLHVSTSSKYAAQHTPNHRRAIQLRSCACLRSYPKLQRLSIRDVHIAAAYRRMSGILFSPKISGKRYVTKTGNVGSSLLRSSHALQASRSYGSSSHYRRGGCEASHHP